MPTSFRPRTNRIQRRTSKSIGVVVVFFAFSVYLATAIDAFPPRSTNLRIPQRIMDKNRNNFGVFKDSVLQRPASKLRGGFLLLPSRVHPAWISIGIYGLVDLAGFLISAFTGSHLHLDLLGTGAFALAALPSLGSKVARIRCSSAAILLWGTKLSLFLFYRATQVKHDSRLTEVLATTQGSFQFWFITLVWNLMTSLPALLGLNSTRENPLSLIAGGSLYLMGFTIESLADAQKYYFKKHPSTLPNQFCKVGLWKYSQHPNWFGNLLLWTGILVMNLPALIEPMSTAGRKTSNGLLATIMARLWSVRKLLLACLGPGFLWLLFNGQATGSITNAVELAHNKYGGNPDYADYIKTVPLIFPKINFKSS